MHSFFIFFRNNYIMKQKKIVFFLLIFLNYFYGLEVYVTGINLKKAEEGIVIEWMAETNIYNFIIYRNFDRPIDRVERLKESEIIFSNTLTGVEKDNYYVFKYVDSLIKNKNLYYMVLPEKNITKEDFIPNINFNYKPFFVKEDKIKIKNIFAKRSRESIIILWDVEGEVGDKLSFKLYKKNSPFQENDIYSKPYAERIEDFYFEDIDVKYGEDYYYLILTDKDTEIIKENQIFLKGEFFPTNNILIEKELKVREKIKKSDFIKNFTNQGNKNER